MKAIIPLFVLSLLVSLIPGVPGVGTKTAAQEKSVVGQSSVSEANSPNPIAADGMALPEYNDRGELLRPEGFERWVVVGTSIGLSYSDGKEKNPEDPGQFHNVYLQPQAFDHFVKTGEFPEQTIFVVTNNQSVSTKGKDSLNRHGYFAAPSTGLEVAVRDTKRFPDAWAYFMYHDDPQTPAAETPAAETPAAKTKTHAIRPAEAAYPRTACYDCHAEHGAVDNVFTQFYSVLSQAREKHVAQRHSDQQ